jgi:hypothetical protein
MGTANLNLILRTYLREALEADQEKRLAALYGCSVTGGGPPDVEDEVEADLARIMHAC